MKLGDWILAIIVLAFLFFINLAIGEAQSQCEAEGGTAVKAMCYK